MNQPPDLQVLLAALRGYLFAVAESDDEDLRVAACCLLDALAEAVTAGVLPRARR